MRDALDVEDWVIVVDRVKPGVIAERSLGAQLIQVYVAFQDDLSRRRDRQPCAAGLRCGRRAGAGCRTEALRTPRRIKGTPMKKMKLVMVGNGMACVWARAMGLPIQEIVFAVNAGELATPLALVATVVAPPNVPLAPLVGAVNVTETAGTALP